MRISDWSSDVCSSDLRAILDHFGEAAQRFQPGQAIMRTTDQFDALRTVDDRALDRERERLRDIDAPPRRDRLDHRTCRYGFRAVAAEPGEERGNLIVDAKSAPPRPPFPALSAVDSTGVAGHGRPSDT